MITETTDRETAEWLWTHGPDWTCPQCRYINKAIREKCRNCAFDSALVSGDHYFPVADDPGLATKGGKPQ